MSIACVALFAAFANGESLIPQGANVAPPTGRGAKFRLFCKIGHGDSDEKRRINELSAA